MKLDHIDYTIGSHFLSALINDDRSGLNDDDEKAFHAWLDEEARPFSHFDVLDNGGNFARCDVTGLHSDCINVRQYFRVE